jgi:biopolymer transport protein ExbB
MRSGLSSIALLGWLVAASAPAGAQDAPAEAPTAAPLEAPAETPPPEPKTLDALLERVNQGWNVESAEDGERERAFRAARDQQQEMLGQARATLSREEQRSEELESVFQQQEIDLAQLEQQLSDRLGAMGELFGVVRQVAGDSMGEISASLTSAPLPDRVAFLEKLGQSKGLPEIEQLERFWYTLHQEMTELGKVVRFPATVVSRNGDEVQTEVIRVGGFNVIADGKYLAWEPMAGKLTELPSQPPSRYLSTVEDFEESEDEVATLAVDPSRGALLVALLELPDLSERIDQGGAIGYVCITLGVIGFLIAVWRLIAVSVTGRHVQAQRSSDHADAGNPLGRVLAVYERNRDFDTETLELRLDEAVMKESGELQKYLWLVKTVSVVAPLLGILGTVTGMIRTFQAIVLFGSGDPKVMADGIAEALVTTVLGLLVAIPLTLLYAMASNNAGRITDVLDQQSAGLIALRAERQNAAG